MEPQGFTLTELLLALFLVTSLSLHLVTQQTHILANIRQQIELFYLEILQDNTTENLAH